MCGPRVLVVGGGLTAAALSCRLAGSMVSLTCWDKAFKPGGRMTTKRRGNAQIDLGPQFITRQHGENDVIFKELVTAGALKPLRLDKNFSYEENAQNSSSSFVMDEGDVEKDALSVGVDDTVHRIKIGETHLMKPENYVAVNGTDDIVQHFWNKSRIEPLTEHFVSELNQADDSEHWIAQCSNQNKSDIFDAVVFTQPVPQYINTLSPEGRPTGNYLDRIRENDETYQNLLKIRYFSSFSLGLLYNRQQQLPLDWTVRYFPENRVLRYVCVDTVRRGKPEQPTSICIQTQRSWSEDNLSLEKHEATPVILEELRKHLPDLPTPDHLIPHRWRYSQTRVHYPQCPGAVQLCSGPLLIGAGDSFSVSNVEGCLHSARVAANLIRNKFNLE